MVLRTALRRIGCLRVRVTIGFRGFIIIGTGAYAYNASDGAWSVTFGFGGMPLGPPFTNLSQLRPIRDVEVLSPSQMIALGDAAIVPPEPDGPYQMGLPMAPCIFSHLMTVMFSTGTPGGASTLSVQDNAMLQRHGGRWNESFCDGHVENGTLGKFFDRRKDDVLRLWNRDNEPHREHGPP